MPFTLSVSGPGPSLAVIPQQHEPYITRFSQPDTIIPDLNNPQSLNRYSYTLNNPINSTDPTGHCTTFSKKIMSDDQCEAGTPPSVSGSCAGFHGNALYTCETGKIKRQADDTLAALYTNPVIAALGGTSSGCNILILWNGSSWCHQNTYESQSICLSMFDCSATAQMDYASRFQYPGQSPWNPVTNKAERAVVGGDLFPGSAFYQLGAIRVAINGSTMTNYTQPSHILYDGQIDRTISNDQVTTSGHGTNSNLLIAAMNQYGGPLAFEAVDHEMLIFSTADQLSHGALMNWTP